MSSASIVGLALLEPPIQVHPDQPLTLHFDAQLYLGPGRTVIASLRYYNGNHLSFNDDVGQYFIWANVSCIHFIHSH